MRDARRRRARRRGLRRPGPAPPVAPARSAASTRRRISRGTCGLPVVPALRRVRATPTQTGLPAAQRHRNVRDAFAADPRGARRLRGAVVVLVDDVSTTGATLEACARVLKEAECGRRARGRGALTAAPES